MRWSVGIEAESDRVLTREQVVDLADAVAEFDGIATGIGTSRYGAQLVVEAASREAAIDAGTANFRKAAATAGLPEGPIIRAEAISEAEDQAEFESAEPESAEPESAEPESAELGSAELDSAAEFDGSAGSGASGG